VQAVLILLLFGDPLSQSLKSVFGSHDRLLRVHAVLALLLGDSLLQSFKSVFAIHGRILRVHAVLVLQSFKSVFGSPGRLLRVHAVLVLLLGDSLLQSFKSVFGSHGRILRVHAVLIIDRTIALHSGIRILCSIPTDLRRRLVMLCCILHAHSDSQNATTTSGKG
jgi:hypothetical protein